MERRLPDLLKDAKYSSMSHRAHDSNFPMSANIHHNSPDRPVAGKIAMSCKKREVSEFHCLRMLSLNVAFFFP